MKQLTHQKPTAADLIRMHQELPGLKRMHAQIGAEISAMERLFDIGTPLLLEGEVVSHSFNGNSNPVPIVIPEATVEQRAAFVQEPEEKVKTMSKQQAYWANMSQRQRKAEMARRMGRSARKRAR